VLFRVQKVQVKLNEFDLPGPTRRKILCSSCGQVIRDSKEVVADGRTLCKPCTGESYFIYEKEITWPQMNWSPANHSRIEAYE
jgi:formylmethanofuran dehydrogenase subunit E